MTTDNTDFLFGSQQLLPMSGTEQLAFGRIIVERRKFSHAEIGWRNLL
jgi:hypothetical protein